MTLAFIEARKKEVIEIFLEENDFKKYIGKITDPIINEIESLNPGDAMLIDCDVETEKDYINRKNCFELTVDFTCPEGNGLTFNDKLQELENRLDYFTKDLLSVLVEDFKAKGVRTDIDVSTGLFFNHDDKSLSKVNIVVNFEFEGLNEQTVEIEFHSEIPYLL